MRSHDTIVVHILKQTTVDYNSHCMFRFPFDIEKADAFNTQGDKWYVFRRDEIWKYAQAIFNRVSTNTQDSWLTLIPGLKG